MSSTSGGPGGGCTAFAMRAAAEMNKVISGLHPDAVAMMQRHRWPGNVRELQHAVERAVILSTESVLHVDAFDRERFGLGQRFNGGTAPASVASTHPGNGPPAHAALPPGAGAATFAAPAPAWLFNPRSFR